MAFRGRRGVSKFLVIVFSFEPSLFLLLQFRWNSDLGISANCIKMECVFLNCFDHFFLFGRLVKRRKRGFDKKKQKGLMNQNQTDGLLFSPIKLCNDAGKILSLVHRNSLF